jgi:uncharacterized membrane protein
MLLITITRYLLAILESIALSTFVFMMVDGENNKLLYALIALPMGYGIGAYNGYRLKQEKEALKEKV